MLFPNSSWSQPRSCPAQHRERPRFVWFYLGFIRSWRNFAQRGKNLNFPGGFFFFPLKAPPGRGNGFKLEERRFQWIWEGIPSWEGGEELGWNSQKISGSVQGKAGPSWDMAGSWDWMIFEILPNPKHSVIPQFQAPTAHPLEWDESWDT